MSEIKRIGVLTGGGDCPGINAVIRAVTKTAIFDHGWHVLGIEDGFLGLIENRTRPLARHDVGNILTRGGTILGTSNKADPSRFAVERDKAGNAVFEDVREKAAAHYRAHQLDALVVIGGDGTMSCAHAMAPLDVRCVGVPKTIDNDLMHTHITFGFQTAVEIGTEAIDRVHTTATSHHRILVVELMGRNAGWLTLHAGLAGGADIILIPEIPYDLGKLCEFCKERMGKGRTSTIIAVAEGAAPAGGKPVVDRTIVDSPEPIRYGGVGHQLQRQLEMCSGFEARSVVLGHTLRGGTPCAADRVLATRLGHKAIGLLASGKTGQLVVVQHGQLSSVPISEVANQQRRVPTDHDLIRAARAVGTCFGD